MTHSTQPFPEALHDLARERGHRKKVGSVNYRSLARELPTITYETLRKLTSGLYPPSPAQLEELAAALAVTPDYFLEYRLWERRRMFDPREVGIDEALRNLREDAMGGDGGAGHRQARRPSEERTRRPAPPAALPV